MAQHAIWVGIMVHITFALNVRRSEAEGSAMRLDDLKRLALSFWHLFRTRRNLEIFQKEYVICLRRHTPEFIPSGCTSSAYEVRLRGMQRPQRSLHEELDIEPL